MSASLGGWSTCADVIKAFPDTLKDSTVIITGPTSGIGVETSVQLAAVCGHLVLAARSADKAAAVIAECERRNGSSSGGGGGGGGRNVTHIPCDLSSLESVKEFVRLYRQAAEGLPPLRCLVLNAGLICFSHQESTEGFEQTFAVSHLAHFLLATELLPELQAAAPSRVVVVSSGSHFGPLATSDMSVPSLRRYVVGPDRQGWGVVKGMRAYGSAKLCNSVFAASFHRRYSNAGGGVSCCSLHPGTLMATSITRESGVASFALGRILSWFTKSMDQGSSTTLACCLREEGGGQTQTQAQTQPQTQGQTQSQAQTEGQIEGRFYSDCQRATCSTRVTDVKSQEALWVLSEELCGPFRG